MEPVVMAVAALRHFCDRWTRTYLIRAIMVTFLSFGWSVSAFADTVRIEPFNMPVPVGSPARMQFVFPNEVIEGNVKVLSFEGFASNLSDRDGRLLISFAFDGVIDGGTFLIPANTSNVALSATGRFEFCPPEVVLMFEVTELGVPITNVNGTFTHDCVPTPEPTTILLLGTALAGVAIKTRKKLKRRREGKGRQ